MSRVYAKREDSGAMVLVAIVCDRAGCTASTKPNADIASSGWTKRGFDRGPGMTVEYDGCPEHDADTCP